MTRLAAFAAAALCLLAPASAGAGGSRPPAALSASPSRIALAGGARQIVRLANPGTSRIVVDVARAGFALDLRGRPLVTARSAGARSAATWLSARPSRLSLGPGGSATFTVASHLPKRAEPGDHGALVLLTTRPARAGKVAVQMRLGIVVTVRAPGKVVHRLALPSLRVRRLARSRLLELALANRGNVTESLDRGAVRVRLLRRGRVFATLRAGRRDLLPRTGGLVALRYRGRVRGAVRAVVAVAPRGRDGRPVRRTFSIRL